MTSSVPKFLSNTIVLTRTTGGSETHESLFHISTPLCNKFLTFSVVLTYQKKIMIL